MPPPFDENREIDVAGLHEVLPGRVRFVEADGRDIMLFRAGDKVHAWAARCTHAFANLQDGTVLGDVITCAVHGAQFNLATGRPLNMACPPLQSYPVRVSGGRILVTVY